jgi:hypothetical protein
LGLVNDVNMLVKLYAEGGIEICSPEEKIASSQSNGDQVFMIRTFIQPDGDVILYVSKEVLSCPDIWRQHHEKIRNKIDCIRRLRMRINWIWMLSPPIFLIGYVALGFEQIWQFVLVSILTLIPFALKPILKLYFGLRIKNEIKHVCS